VFESKFRHPVANDMYLTILRLRSGDNVRVIDTVVLRILSGFILMINDMRNVGRISIQNGLGYSVLPSLPPSLQKCNCNHFSVSSWQIFPRFHSRETQKQSLYVLRPTSGSKREELLSIKFVAMVYDYSYCVWTLSIVLFSIHFLIF
jgi:hypothetical protein